MRKKETIDPIAVGKRIKDIRGGRTLHEFAKLIGVSHMSVKRYEEGTLPDINTMMAIAKVGKEDLGRLLLGKPLPADVRDQRPLKFIIDSPDKARSGWPNEADYITVPLTAGTIAAGSPRITEDDVIDYFLIHLRAIKKSGASRNLISCRLEGDSMLPHLCSGDIVVIDRGIDKEKLDENKIYAIFEDGGITAKKIQKEGYHLYLIPTNHSERVRHIDLRENDSPIVGLVIGAWRNFDLGA